jgi:integrase
MPSVLQHTGSRPYWYIRYRQKVLVGKDQIERKEIWHPLGYCDEITKREAMRLREQVLHQVNNQVYTIQSQIAFEEFVKMYSEHHLVTLAPGGRKRDLSFLKNHVLPAFSGRKLCEVGTQEIQTFLNAKDADGLSYWTRKAMHAILGSIFTKADDWGYWDGSRNPVSRVRIGRERFKREKRILTDDQLRALLAELRPETALMVRTAVSTGMRVSEIIGLKWRAVDLEHGLVHVQERYYRGDTDEPKTDKSKRPLPLGYLTEEFRELRSEAEKERGKMGGHEYVFHKDGKPLDDRDLLRDIIRPTAERLGLHFEGFGWHSFRRQNITLIQEEGATPFEAMEQAGHTRSTMTSHYTVVALTRREQAVRRVQERLFGIQEKKGPTVASLRIVRDCAG